MRDSAGSNWLVVVKERENRGRKDDAQKWPIIPLFRISRPRLHDTSTLSFAPITDSCFAVDNFPKDGRVCMLLVYITRLQVDSLNAPRKGKGGAKKGKDG